MHRRHGNTLSRRYAVHPFKPNMTMNLFNTDLALDPPIVIMRAEYHHGISGGFEMIFAPNCG